MIASSVKHTLNIRGLLHDHVDGSAAMINILPQLYHLAGQTAPCCSPEGWRQFFGNPMGDIVAKFAAVTSVLQSREALQLAADAYVERRAADGYRYVEAKFAPQYHCAGGLTMKEVVTTMTDALCAAGNRRGVLVLPVICIGREAEPATGVEIAKLALEAHHECALDLVCFEPAFPPERHLPAYQLTKGRIKREAHAGEWVFQEPAATYRQRLLANVRTAVFELEVDGLGHAIPLVDDLANGQFIIEEMLARNIRVTSCPASYVQLGFIKSPAELGMAKLLDAGIGVTINPDDDIFLPPMPEVKRLVLETGELATRHLRQLERNVFLTGFHSRVSSLVP